MALGAVALWAAPQVERQMGVVRAIAAAIFLGGLARVISIASVGEPHSSQLLLMALELALPPIILWLSAGARDRGKAPPRGELP